MESDPIDFLAALMLSEPPSMPRTTKSPTGERRRGRTARHSAAHKRKQIATLAVDVGGSHVKASVLDGQGRLLHEQLRVDTPDEPTPRQLVDLIVGLCAKLPAFDRVSVG